MFPNEVFLGLDLYWWLIVIGVLAAMACFRLFYEQAGLSTRVFNFSLICAVFGIFLGYLSAVLFQSWYAYLASGVFEFGVGATFYGGLIGAIAVVLAIYFGAGHFLFKDKRHLYEFNRMLSLIFPCIVIAHALGRVGCLFEGCCYGAVTDSWVGIMMYSGGEWAKRVPIQLFEAIFLALLFLVLLFLVVKKKNEYTMSIYFIVYGVWRFVIEYFRADVRGASGISFLTPSQLTAILMVLAGIAYIFFYKYWLKARLEKFAPTEKTPPMSEGEGQNEEKTDAQEG